MGTKVKLLTFNGTTEAPSDCEQSENYWALIGQVGTVIQPENQNSRVLVQFNNPISDFGLHCHNEVKNTLFILSSDLGQVE